jgi:hypothetical protein
MNIDELTIREAKKLAALFTAGACNVPTGISSMIGKKAIIRTYSAGVWFGEVAEKEGNEIILKNARRLYYWKTVNKGLSLSEVAMLGLHRDSKVCQAVPLVWLQPIEIIPCSDVAIESIEGASDYKA